MTMQITIPAEAQQEAEKANTILAAAQAFRVETPEQYMSAGAELKRIKAQAAAIDAKRKAITEPLDRAKKEAMDFFRPFLAALDQAELEIKGEMLVFDREQQRIRAEAERKAREEAERIRKEQEQAAAKIEQAAREKREKEEAKARELEAQGRQAEAEAKREAADRAEALRIQQADAKRTAAAQIPAAPVVHIEQPKVAGISTSTVWKFEIVNPDLIPREYLTPDEKAIGGVVRSLKGRASIPGVRIFEETIMSARRA